jgi:hypothetical protein
VWALSVPSRTRRESQLGWRPLRIHAIRKPYGEIVNVTRSFDDAGLLTGTTTTQLLVEAPVICTVAKSHRTVSTGCESTDRAILFTGSNTMVNCHVGSTELQR